MKKNFFTLSLALNVIASIVAIVFSVIFYLCTISIAEGEVFLDFLYYVKTFFDLMAVFIGYTTIIYAFSQFDFKNGLISIGVFSISFLMSFVFQVVGACIDGVNSSAEFTTSFFTYAIYYSFGQSFITQMIPALVVALVTYLLTRNGTPKIKTFFSWKNSIQKAMIIITVIVFGLNFLSLTGFTVLPGLISELVDYGSITSSHLTSIIVAYVEVIIFYLVMQYVVYFFMYNIYHNYVIMHPDKKTKNAVKETV